MSHGRSRLAILISGRGSNMEAFLAACRDGTLDADVALVASNRPNALGLQTASAAGIPTVVVNHQEFENREQFDQALGDQVASVQPDLVVLAGFMRVLTPFFVDRFADRLMNIHPSLLPKYPGLNTHQRAIDAGDTETGATVHYVNGELDGGPAIIQARVPIHEHDSADDLAKRILPCEHQIFPLAAQWHVSGRLKLLDGKALLDGEVLPATGFYWAG